VPVRERREENRVDRAFIVQNIQYVVDAFIDKRFGTDLQSDGFFGWGSLRGADGCERSSHQGCRGQCGGAAQERSMMDAGFHKYDSEGEV
jgi:hypothetical protein